MKKRKKWTVENVIDEYLAKATPGEGKIYMPKGYKESLNKEEVSCARWIKTNFGGKIVLIKNSNIVILPDYGWNNKLWELKIPETVKGVDKLVQKGIHQIEDEPGGMILDIKKIDEKDWKKVMESAVNRIKRSSKQTIDLIEKNDNELISILRIKIGDE